MWYLRLLRNSALVAALIVTVAAIAPAGAGESAPCNIAKATQFHEAGKRYASTGHFSDAAHWYLASTRYTRGCLTGNGALLGARALAEAGASLAQSGDLLNALPVLQNAQSQLTALAQGHGQPTAAVRQYVDRVQTVITAINRVAESSM